MYIHRIGNRCKGGVSDKLDRDSHNVFCEMNLQLQIFQNTSEL